MSLKEQITADMKSAMRAGEKDRLSVIRMLLAALKQREIDERIELTDADSLQVVEKLVKQRREAAAQFADAGRNELADKERAEIDVLSGYLPEQLDDAELGALIDAVIAETGAQSMRDMGKVMAAVRDRAAGRADMSAVSARVKAKLAG